MQNVINCANFTDEHTYVSNFESHSEMRFTDFVSFAERKAVTSPTFNVFGELNTNGDESQSTESHGGNHPQC